MPAGETSLSTIPPKSLFVAMFYATKRLFYEKIFLYIFLIAFLCVEPRAAQICLGTKFNQNQILLGCT